MKNYSKRCLWLIGGILLSSILCLVVSAVNVNIDISNAVQHINAVKLISNSENNEVIISKIGSNLVNVETNSNIIFGNENVIEESNENSTILGGSNNNVGKGKFSTIIAGLENNISGEGEGNTILGGYENNIKGQNSVIAGGKGNYIEGNASSIVGGENNNIMGNHSVTVGKNNSVTGNLSVAMGINSYVSGNNSFLWSDSTRSDVLEADNVFAIVSQNGMVVNSNTSNPNAKLTLGGSLVVASNDKDQDIVCEGGTGAGIVKAVLTGDQYCLCSCDGQGRNSMFGGGICKSICNGDTQPICGTGVSLIHSGSSYMFEGSCEQGNIVEGTGAYLLDKNNVLHWACQLGNGESVLCSSSDITPVYRSCELPWGGTIQHGESVVAYENDKPAGTCVPGEIHCNDGELEGNYRYNNCVNGCQKPWSDEYIPSGETLEAFKYNVVGFREGYLCDLSQNRLCTDGVLDGEADYKYKECKPENPRQCEYMGGNYEHLTKLIRYNNNEGMCPDDGCNRHMVVGVCYDGEWKDGSNPDFWREKNEKYLELVEGIDINEIEPVDMGAYSFTECKNKSSDNDYVLDGCPLHGSCDYKNVSIANNERPIPACESAHKYKLLSCNAGYYKNGNSCTQCPTGYTSNTGATAQNQCFISCNDRYHIATLQASSCTGCANGTYKSGHNVNYGSKSSCVYCTNGPANSNYTTNGINNDCDWQCNAGYYKYLGSCNRCPTGYTSNTGATTQNQCYINCTAGNYLAEANDSSCTACPTGKTKSQHTVYYGDTSSCIDCTSWKPDHSSYYNGCNRQCDAGYYKEAYQTYNNQGGWRCTKCPDGRTSDTGATSLTECYALPQCGTKADNPPTHTQYYTNDDDTTYCTVGQPVTIPGFGVNLTEIWTTATFNEPARLSGYEWTCRHNGHDERCFGRLPNSCTSPCGTINHGETKTCYVSNSANCPNTCHGESYDCKDGELWGTGFYQYSNGNGVLGPFRYGYHKLDNIENDYTYPSCTLNGQSTDGYFNTELECENYYQTGSICVSETLSILSGSNGCDSQTVYGFDRCEEGYHVYQGKCWHDALCGGANNVHYDSSPRGDTCNNQYGSVVSNQNGQHINSFVESPNRSNGWQRKWYCLYQGDVSDQCVAYANNRFYCKKRWVQNQNKCCMVDQTQYCEECNGCDL